MDNKDRITIDALDPKAWGGIVMAKGADTAFAFRFATDVHGLLDGESIYEAVREVGPHAPDGSYCRLSWSVAAAPGDMFSIRWEGKLSVPSDGLYTFYVTSDDGCRLFIDGAAVIDEWWDRVPTEFSAPLYLAAGDHEIRLDYYESVGSASVRLEWSSDAIARQVIPSTALSHQGGPGLLGSYYYGTHFEEFAFSRVDERIDFDYGHGGPLPEREIDERVCLEWSRTDDRTVVGRFTLGGGVGGRVLLLCYLPWDYQGEFAVRDGRVVGKNADDVFTLATSPSPMSASVGESADKIKTSYTSTREMRGGSGDSAAAMLVELRPGRPVYFTASLDAPAANIHPRHIGRLLSGAEAAYLASRTEADGALARLGESITNNINWMRLLIPHTQISYVPAGRVWIWSSWTVFEWDGFLNALLASVENPDLAHSMIDALLYSQQPDGNIPNNANDPSGPTSIDRSQPQVGIYCAWKLYLRLGRDIEFLREVYPALVRWHDWWLADGGTGRPRRDGNRDGLLEWGSDGGDMQNAKFESGMDDSPLFDDAEFVPDTWTMNMNCVDCSSLYALDALCLARMARDLGLPDDEKRYADEHERMKQLINDVLWCEEEGMYLNRFWDGRFSRRMGCANFYPMIAQVATPQRAARMVEKLTDPEFFHGDWMVPTISRNDPAWKDQFYWRGTVWPPTNYLVYEGLRTYPFDREAAGLAESGARLFLENWKREGTCRENYRSDTGEGGGQKYQSWGPLFSLIALQEFVDVEPDGTGLRFGSLTTERSTVRNVRIAGHSYDVTIGGCLRVRRDGEPILDCDASTVIHHYRVSSHHLSFFCNAERECTLRVQDSLVCEPGAEPYTIEVPHPSTHVSFGLPLLGSAHGTMPRHLRLFRA